MKLLLSLTLVLGCLSEIALGCEAMNAAQLQQRIQKEPAEQLVFFASWCASCKKHLTQDMIAKSYFVAAFDEQPAAVKVYNKFLGEANLKRCIWDSDGTIAEAYGVKSLPAMKPLKQVAAGK